MATPPLHNRPYDMSVVGKIEATCAAFLAQRVPPYCRYVVCPR
jgi:hypothetical protein